MTKHRPLENFRLQDTHFDYWEPHLQQVLSFFGIRPPVYTAAEWRFIIAGGLSEYIWSGFALCKAIGGSGRPYCFEPDPIDFIRAYDQVQEKKELGYFSVIPLGLWEKKTTLQFTSAGVGSHVAIRRHGLTCSAGFHSSCAMPYARGSTSW